MTNHPATPTIRIEERKPLDQEQIPQPQHLGAQLLNVTLEVESHFNEEQKASQPWLRFKARAYNISKLFDMCVTDQFISKHPGMTVDTVVSVFAPEEYNNIANLTTIIGEDNLQTNQQATEEFLMIFQHVADGTVPAKQSRYVELYNIMKHTSFIDVELAEKLIPDIGPQMFIRHCIELTSKLPTSLNLTDVYTSILSSYATDLNKLSLNNMGSLPISFIADLAKSWKGLQTLEYLNLSETDDSLFQGLFRFIANVHHILDHHFNYDERQRLYVEGLLSDNSDQAEVLRRLEEENRILNGQVTQLTKEIATVRETASTDLTRVQVQHKGDVGALNGEIAGLRQSIAQLETRAKTAEGQHAEALATLEQAQQRISELEANNEELDSILNIIELAHTLSTLPAIPRKESRFRKITPEPLGDNLTLAGVVRLSVDPNYRNTMKDIFAARIATYFREVLTNGKWDGKSAPFTHFLKLNDIAELLSINIPEKNFNISGITFADDKSCGAIADEIRSITEALKDAQLQPNDISEMVNKLPTRWGLREAVEECIQLEQRRKGTYVQKERN